jgi:nucleotide-binding universal stress UspA family protein
VSTVIVPLDGTDRAEAAIPYARALAADGRVELLVARWEGEPPAPEDYLAARAGALLETGLAVDTRVVDAPPADAIVAAAEAPGALVCMTTHGRHTISRAVLGSTAEAVVRTVRRPVVLVGPRARCDTSRAGAPVLVVAVDTPDAAAVLAPVAADLADRLGWTIAAVESVPAAPYPFVADAAIARTEAHGLVELEQRLDALHHAIDGTVVLSMDPAAAIVEHATAQPTALLLLGTHARRGVARVVLGSTAMEVVRCAPVPVMVVPL